MLPENVNWNAVLQSITDTWLPLIGMVAAIILVAIIVHDVRGLWHGTDCHPV